MNDARRTAEIALRTFVTARWVVFRLVALGWSVQHASPEPSIGSSRGSRRRPSPAGPRR